MRYNRSSSYISGTEIKCKSIASSWYVVPSVILNSPGLQFVDVTHKSSEALKSHCIIVSGPASVVHSSVRSLLNVAMTLSGIISVKPAGETTKGIKSRFLAKIMC